jgi:predicted transcriptional regulator
MKNVTVDVEGFDEFKKRSLARARLLDRGLKLEPETRISFETAEDMVRCLTPLRLKLLEAARLKEASITELAEMVGRDRTAVQRDIKVLAEYGLLVLTKQVNPGHGQVQMVKAAAGKITLTAQV